MASRQNEINVADPSAYLFIYLDYSTLADL